MVRFLVYRDRRYLSGWINDWVTEKIVEYLSSEAELVFEESNAQELEDLMEAVIERGEASESVVVFAQDLIPHTIAERPSPDALIRRYLNAGGRVIWIGDVPFFWQGLPNREKQMWGAPAQNSILETAMETILNLPPLQINIRPDGETQGLGLSWAGHRPVVDRVGTLTARLATSEWHGFTLIHAWFKNLDTESSTSGFIRIWDYILHDMSDRLLMELYNIATYGRR